MDVYRLIIPKLTLVDSKVFEESDAPVPGRVVYTTNGETKYLRAGGAGGDFFNFKFSGDGHCFRQGEAEVKQFVRFSVFDEQAIFFIEKISGR